MDIPSIVMDAGMSARPAYYSGRGATITDLTDKILFKIQADIKKHFGEKQAKAFVQMVANIKVLSATTFLQELYDLEARGWKVKPVKAKDASGVMVDKDDKTGEYNMTNGMFGMLAAMTHDGSDDTGRIRNNFLRSNGVKVENCRWEDMVYGRKRY